MDAWRLQYRWILPRSLGGGITVDFASCFPDMVKSIVLLAPAGLIRPYHYSWASRFLVNGIIPDSIVEWLTQRRMGGAGTYKSVVKRITGDQDHPTTNDELKGNRDHVFESAYIALGKSSPGVTIADVIRWQVNNHQGFIRAFMSSVRHSSIEEKQETWAKLGRRSDKVLIIAGTTDPVILAKELEEDAEATIGQKNVEWREVDGGHEFPVSDAGKVVALVSDFWGL